MNKREATNYARVMDTLRKWDFTREEPENGRTNLTAGEHDR